MGDPLIAEAAKKAEVAWVSVAGGPARLWWCFPHGGDLWVVTGPGEQDAGDLAPGAPTVVTLRGDHGGRIVTWPATVTRVEPGSEEWAEVVPQLAGKRLNAPLGPAALADRWGAECAVYRLAPAGAPVEAAGSGSMPVDPLAEPPRDTPVRRRTRRPFRLHKVRGAR